MASPIIQMQGIRISPLLKMYMSGLIPSIIQSAKLNGLDPYAYLNDVLKRLPTHKVTQIEELLTHRWKPEPN
jgi:hypothetical protein